MKKKKDKKYIEYEDGTRVELGPDDSPEWTRGDFRKAKRGRKALEEIFGKKGTKELLAGKITLKPIGRPKKDNPKISISIRLDADLVKEYRSHGKGWQTEINTVLRRNLEDRV